MCGDVRPTPRHLGAMAELAARLPAVTRNRRAVSTIVVNRDPCRTRISRDTEADEPRRTTRCSGRAGQSPHWPDATAFDDALVESWEPHEGTFNLPDQDDEHVVAAALVGGAGAIVTVNLRDFPIAKIPAHIKVLSPAAFAADTVAVSPDVALRAAQTMASRYSASPLTTEEILNRLVQRYQMTEAVELIRAVI